MGQEVAGQKWALMPAILSLLFSVQFRDSCLYRRIHDIGLLTLKSCGSSHRPHSETLRVRCTDDLEALWPRSAISVNQDPPLSFLLCEVGSERKARQRWERCWGTVV